MECPHLQDCVRITTVLNKPDNNSRWHCTVCETDKSLWICLFCGVVQCGRYVNGHAKAHFEDNEGHAVCLDYGIVEPSVEETLKLEPPSRRKRRKRSLSGDSSSIENYRVLRKRKKPETKIKTKDNLRVVGLRNLGNTCFMNAVLQSLSNIQQFCKYFTQLPALDASLSKNGKKNCDKKKPLTGEDILLAEELRKTLLSLHQVSKTAISPESLFSVIWKVVPRFRGYQQQDAHEFLRYMLDRLHTELLNILPYPNGSSLFIGPKGKSTIVTNIFGGVLQNEVNCLVCKTESKKHDPFLDLSLDIPHPHVKLTGSKSKEKESPGPSCQLQDCLNSFTEVEELAETELYYCSFCKKKQRSTKKFWIRRLPNVLCLHIKRFRWSNYFRMKIDNYIEFPLRGLDMSKFMLSNMHETRGNGCKCTLYDLAAVIVHHGSGAGSGHYTAYATHEGSWYHFNDSTVTKTDEETVAKSKAYIFFYIRREFKLPPVAT
ncbi:Ubiquitin carboxyl-terminal hydrolase 3 [Chamberlinius hualienensis]